MILTALLSSTLAATPAGAPHHPETTPTKSVESAADPNPLKALDTWLKLYRKGRIDYRSAEPLGKKSIALKYKAVSYTHLTLPTIE